MQKTAQKFKSECGRAEIYVENDMPIGVFHDFLMAIKGLMVDRMVAAHQEQTAQAAEALAQPPHESELPVTDEAAAPYCPAEPIQE